MACGAVGEALTDIMAEHSDRSLTGMALPLWW